MLLGMGREEGGGERERERERGKGRRRARVRTGKRVGTNMRGFIRHSNFNCVRVCVLLFNLKKKTWYNIARR